LNPKGRGSKGKNSRIQGWKKIDPTSIKTMGRSTAGGLEGGKKINKSPSEGLA